MIVVILIALSLLLFASLKAYTRHHGMWRLTWRFIAGHHLDGHRRTDAGYLRPGKRVMHATGHASRWAHLPHLYRAGIRWGVLLFLVSVAFGLLRARTITVAILAGIFLIVTGVSVAMAGKKVRGHQHYRATARPLSLTLAGMLGTTAQVVDSSLVVKSGYAKAKGGERVATLILPNDFAANPGQRVQVEHLFTARLGIDVRFAWKTSKRPMTLEVNRAPIPPTLVKFADMLPVLQTMPKDKVLLGITGEGEQKVWDQGSEDPHCLVAANTRRGKTRLLLLIVSQILHQGAERVTAIDPKRVGLDEALAGIPGVDIHSDPRDIGDFWDAIRDFRAFMDDRIEMYAKDRTIEFKPALLVIDEVSQFAAMSKQYWEDIRPPKSKANPPIWQDIAAILWQGAQFKCRVLVFGQRLEFSTLGGMIESFGTRLLAGYTKNSYMRLIGIMPVPASQKPRGRFLFFDGDSPTWIQAILGNDIELRDFAMANRLGKKTGASNEVQDSLPVR